MREVRRRKRAPARVATYGRLSNEGYKILQFSSNYVDSDGVILYVLMYLYDNSAVVSIAGECLVTAPEMPIGGGRGSRTRQRSTYSLLFCNLRLSFMDVAKERVLPSVNALELPRMASRFTTST